MDARAPGVQALDLGGHRVNDLVYGHPGRLSYVPPEDDEDDQGHLYMNRSIGRGEL